VERGEVWWAQFDGKRLVVLLSGGAGQEFPAMQIVEPVAPEQSLGFVLMSGDQAVDADERRRVVAEAGPDPRAVMIEVFLGAEEGLAEPGVVRVALPKDGTIFCTWRVTIDADELIERVGVLPPEKRHELDVALQLAGE
jgi:mRNA interferase MazF